MTLLQREPFFPNVLYYQQLSGFMLISLVFVYNEEKQRSLNQKLLTYCQEIIKPLKTPDAIGNCQRPVFTAGVSQHM